jgi:hypothetical protein
MYLVSSRRMSFQCIASISAVNMYVRLCPSAIPSLIDDIASNYSALSHSSLSVFKIGF